MIVDFAIVYIWYLIILADVFCFCSIRRKKNSFKKSQNVWTTVHERMKWPTDVEEFFRNLLEPAQFALRTLHSCLYLTKTFKRTKSINNKLKSNNNINVAFVCWLFVTCCCLILAFSGDRCDFWRIRAGIFHWIETTQKRQTHAIYGAVRLWCAHRIDMKETTHYDLFE